MKKTKNALWGFLFIVLGIIIGLNALDITDINIFFKGWWTLFIIIPCLIGLFNETDKTGNLVGIFIGVALLLAFNGVINFDMIWKLLFPIILIMIGLTILLKNTIETEISKKVKTLNKKDKKLKEYCSTFSGQVINFDNETFDGAKMSCVFGSLRLDLRNAKIKEDSLINIETIFGGVEILVPEDYVVKVKSTPIFGGVSNKKSNGKKDTKTIIYVDATVVFGGIDIK